MNLETTIQRLVQAIIPPPVITGKVISIDEKAMTCDVEIPKKPTRYDVRLRAVIDNVESGVLIIPKLNSRVVLDTLEGRKTASYVAMFSEVESIKLISDENGGLVISSDLVQKINTIEKDLNSLKTVFKTWVPPTGAPDSGAALKTALTAYMSQSISLTKSQDIESKTVSHG